MRNLICLWYKLNEQVIVTSPQIFQEKRLNRIIRIKFSIIIGCFEGFNWKDVIHGYTNIDSYFEY